MASKTKGFASKADRLIQIVPLVVTITLSVLLFIFITPRRYTGNGYTWLSKYAFEANLVANVLSTLLPIVQLYPLKTAFNLTGRTILRNKDGLDLARLQCWGSLSEAKFQHGSAKIMTYTALFAAFAALPALAWFSALVPVITITPVNAIITVPIYTSDTQGQYWNTTWNAYASTDVTLIGNESYSYFPGATQASSLLNSFATASSSDSSSARRHRKSDGSAYSYIGRSYGVGASVGLVQPTFTADDVKSPTISYTYNETGYQTMIQCTYNESSDWSISLQDSIGNGSFPNLFLAQGSISPGNFLEDYAVVGFGSGDSIVALIAGGHDITNNIVIAAGDGYDDLNNVQCAVSFQPTVFGITVSLLGRNITVNPLFPGIDVDPTSSSQPNGRGRLQQAALWELTRLSMRNSGLYSSLLGESLHSNIQRRSGVSDAGLATQQQRLDAISESFEASLDDVLLAISSAQFGIGPGDAKLNTNVEVIVAAISIGKSDAAWAVLFLSVGIGIFWLALASRMKFWKWAPTWDFSNITDVFKAASGGRHHIAMASTEQEAHSQEEGWLERCYSWWTQKEETKIIVKLERKGSKWVTSLTEDNEAAWPMSSTLEDNSVDTSYKKGPSIHEHEVSGSSWQDSTSNLALLNRS